MRKLLIIGIVVTLFLSATANVAFAKGGGGGRSGGFRSSSFKSSSSRSVAPKAAAAKPKTPAQIKAEKAQAAKVAKQKQVEAAKVKAQKQKETKMQAASNKLPTEKTKNGKSYKKGQTVGVNGYNPRYSGGYVAPVGSTVYYQSNMMDWFFLYYILSHDSHREVVVTQPDKVEKVVKEEATDSMYVINWVILILVLAGVGAGIVWLVNKKTQPTY